MQEGPGDSIELEVKRQSGFSIGTRSPFEKVGNVVSIEPAIPQELEHSRLAAADSSSNF